MLTSATKKKPITGLLGFSIDLKSRNNKFGSIDTLSIVFEVDNRMGDIERIQNRFTFK